MDVKLMDYMSKIMKEASQLANTESDMGRLLLESLTQTRAIMSCWTLGALDNAAYEFVSNSQIRQRDVMRQLRRYIPPTIDGALERQGSKTGFAPRWFSVRLDQMFFHKSKEVLPHKIVDLRLPFVVDGDIKGRTSEFTLEVEGDPKVYRLRAPNDMVKARWVSCLKYYRDKRIIGNKISAQSVSFQLKLYSEHIYRKKAPPDVQHMDNIFATIPRGSKYDPRPNESTKVTVYSAKTSAHGNFEKLDAKFMLKGVPKRIRFFKKGYAKGDDPVIAIARDELINVVVIPAKNSVQIIYESASNKQEECTCAFDSQNSLAKFMSKVRVFRQKNVGFLMHHWPILHQFTIGTAAQASGPVTAGMAPAAKARKSSSKKERKSSHAPEISQSMAAGDDSDDDGPGPPAMDFEIAGDGGGAAASAAPAAAAGPPGTVPMKAIYAWTAKASNQLTCVVGDLLWVKKDATTWWMCTKHSGGAAGYLPSNYLAPSEPHAGAANVPAFSINNDSDSEATESDSD